MSWNTRKQVRGMWLNATALSLVFFSVPATAGELHEVTCELKEENMVPDYQQKADHHCNPANEEKDCNGVLKRIDSFSQILRNHKRETCDKVRDASKRLAALHGVDTYLDTTIGLYEGVLQRYDEHSKNLNEAYEKMAEGMAPVIADPPATAAERPDAKLERENVRANIKQKQKLAKITPTPAKATTPTITGDINKRRFAMNNGVSFMKDLIRESDETMAAKISLEQKVSALKVAKERMKSPGNNNTPTVTGGTSGPSGGGGGGGGGLNPTSLIGLATAATGLYGMLNKQQADSGALTATSPTPDSLNPTTTTTPEASVSKLDSGKSSAPVVSVTPKVDAPQVAVDSPGIPSGTAYNDDSEISDATPAPNKSSAASSKAPGGGGASGGDVGGDAPVVRDPSAAMAEQKDEEAMQGIGGGGLGGGPSGMGSSAMPVDPGVAFAEDSMKELLNEMKETAEGTSEEPLSEIQAEGALIEMSADDLFPRVRAAHVRSLKQGRVLNGLGEKITPDSE